MKPQGCFLQCPHPLDMFKSNAYSINLSCIIMWQIIIVQGECLALPAVIFHHVHITLDHTSVFYLLIRFCLVMIIRSTFQQTKVMSTKLE